MIKERKVLVTGSSDGIGRSITLSLLKSGAKVIGLARDHSKFNPETKNYIKYKTDFSNEEILYNLSNKFILRLPGPLETLLAISPAKS